MDRREFLRLAGIAAGIAVLPASVSRLGAAEGPQVPVAMARGGSPGENAEKAVARSAA